MVLGIGDIFITPTENIDWKGYEIGVIKLVDAYVYYYDLLAIDPHCPIARVYVTLDLSFSKNSRFAKKTIKLNEKNYRFILIVLGVSAETIKIVEQEYAKV